MRRGVPGMAVLLVVAAALAGAGPASGSAVTTKLDPRLEPLLAAGAGPAPVWVSFADKGEQGPADLAAKLAAAEANLTPEARRRRERAGMRPLVDWLDLPIDARYVGALKAAGFAPYGQSRWFNGCAVRTSGADLARLAAMSFVRSVTPAELAAPRGPRPVPGPAFQAPPSREGPLSAGSALVDYGMTAAEMARLNVPALHDSGYTGAGVMICVLDEGFNYYYWHEATRNIDVGHRTRDFVDGDLSVVDTTGGQGYHQHGEWTLSVIGGNKPGTFMGPAFGARYALARTEDSRSEKPIEMVNWAMGAEWADSLGADVISSSLGYTTFPDSAGGAYSITWPMLDGHTSIVTRAAEIAASRGILVVNSAGNDGAAPGTAAKISAPGDADGDSVLSIAAVNSSGVRASFSSIGPTYDYPVTHRIKPDLAAQGVSDYVASADGTLSDYTTLSGTSFSCPLVAGLAACLIQARPTWTMPRIIRALKETASQATAPDTLLGWGIPDGAAALGWVPDTVGIPPGSARLAFSWWGANPVGPGDWPITLQFALGPAARAPSSARIVVYDVRGRVVAVPWSGSLTPGNPATVLWNGDTGRGPLRSGIYFLSLESGGRRVTRRIVSLR